MQKRIIVSIFLKISLAVYLMYSLMSLTCGEGVDRLDLHIGACGYGANRAAYWLSFAVFAVSIIPQLLALLRNNPRELSYFKRRSLKGKFTKYGRTYLLMYLLMWSSALPILYSIIYDTIMDKPLTVDDVVPHRFYLPGAIFGGTMLVIIILTVLFVIGKCLSQLRKTYGNPAE